jgi:hypothetical protein
MEFLYHGKCLRNGHENIKRATAGRAPARIFPYIRGSFLFKSTLGLVNAPELRALCRNYRLHPPREENKRGERGERQTRARVILQIYLNKYLK